MKEITFASLFGGFGGVEIGALAAGLSPKWTIENDAAIAEVARANLGSRVHVRDILDCDPLEFDEVDVLHASPVCTRMSLANPNAGETMLDIRLAEKTAEFVKALKPRVFTLENVWAYRNSIAWHKIEAALHESGYWVSVEHINFADYGVPQTRKRMIVRAVRGGFVPYLPEPVPWIGWYTAVEDLIDTLPESQFAPWQLARLPALLSSTLVGSGGFDGKVVTAPDQEPSFTITANENQLVMRAFLVKVQGEHGRHICLDHEPMPTLTASNTAGKYRALLVGDQTGQIVTEDEPAIVVRAGENGGAMPKAILMAGGGNTNFEEAYPGRGCRYADEPAHTITTTTAGGTMPKAWLVDGSNASPKGQLTIRDEGDPAMTVTTGGVKHPMRSPFENGRVVAMTPRALARFQTFPDWYELPENARLAAKGIGNAVSPRLYERIIQSSMESLQ